MQTVVRTAGTKCPEFSNRAHSPIKRLALGFRLRQRDEQVARQLLQQTWRQGMGVDGAKLLLAVQLVTG